MFVPLGRLQGLMFLIQHPPPPLTPCPRVKWTVSVFSSDHPCKDGNARINKLSDQVWIRYPCFCFFSCLFSFAGSLRKWLAHYLRWEAIEKLISMKHVVTQKTDGIFHIFDQIKVSMVPPCQSGIAIFAWKVTWNYAYSPFKKRRGVKGRMFYSWLFSPFYDSRVPLPPANLFMLQFNFLSNI